jgi:para-aminobenzoate synthetase component 2
MSRILILDNYDSFTYNLAQYVWETGAEAEVARNDEVTVEAILKGGYDGVLISPGPCTPAEAGISEALVRAAAGRIPIFGVCLGMQAIGEALGGRIVSARRILHGKPSSIRHDGKGVLEGLPNPFQAIRYHSLAVDRESLPEQLEISAEAEDGEIMGIRHREWAVEGVQFHPESIGTESGKSLVWNWIRSLGD